MRFQKRLVALVFGLLLLAMSSQALAISVIPKDGIYTPEEVPVEPLVTPDPKAVKMGGTGILVENSEYEDSGKIWISFGHAIADYGCVPARVNYVNQSRSNKGVVITLRISDAELLRAFGTTFKYEDELNELALNGYRALQNGITLSVANNLTLKKDEINSYDRVLSDFDAETVYAMDRNELIWNLGLRNFLGRTAEQLQVLTEEDVYGLDEMGKLMLAHLGGYNFDEYSLSIAEGGLINPGYALYEMDLHNLPGMYVIPKGKYYVFYELQGYDPEKNEMSDFHINLPIVLEVKEDLPQEYLEQYDLKLATHTETYEPATVHATIQ